MPLQIGDVLNGRYQIVAEIKKGGFGAVYKALDLNLRKYCAVKVNLETDQVSKDQFNKEARLLSGLNHPNLPRVTDYFIFANSQILVMDLVEGIDLEEMINQQGRPLDQYQALTWIGQVCDALNYLHMQGEPIIHRDVKPANIRITPQAGPGLPGKAMLVDFGIAKAYSPGTKTDPGARGVSHGYSPWEQYGHGRTDARSDIYALGATLYAVLTMEVPVDSIQRMQGTRLKPPISLNQSIPPHMAGVMLQAMEVEPQNRFQSAVDFKTALNTPSFRYTPGMSPIVAQPPETWQTPSQPVYPPTQPWQASSQPVQSSSSPWPQPQEIWQIPSQPAQPASQPWQIPSQPTTQPVNWKRILPIAAVILLLVSGGIVGVRWYIQKSDNGTPTPGVSTTVKDTVDPSGVGVETPSPTPSPTRRPTSMPLTPSPTPTKPMTPGPTSVIPPGATMTSPVDGAVMVFVPAGEFLMGAADGELYSDPDERPQHSVYVSDFWIDRTEVTNGQYKRFADATGYKTEIERTFTPRVWDDKASAWVPQRDRDINKRYSWRCPRGIQACPTVDPKLPAVFISYEDARAYCEWANKRLPTEAEWEKAASWDSATNTKRIYPWGNDQNLAGKLNFADRTRCNQDTDTCSWADNSVNDGEFGTAQVGKFPAGASPYGAWDMAGNVWEWVADAYSPFFYSSPQASIPDPLNDEIHAHLLRGGSYYDAVFYARTANRYGGFPQDVIDGNVGFRCAMPADSTTVFSTVGAALPSRVASPFAIALLAAPLALLGLLFNLPSKKGVVLL